LAVASVVLCAAAFAVTTDDVSEQNGLATGDPSRLRLFVDHRPAPLVSVARAATDAGSVPILIAFAVLVGALMWWRGTRLLVAAAPAITLGCAGLAVAIVKPVVARARPPLGLRLVNETDWSFPSGHATDSAAVFVSLGLVLAVFVWRRPLFRALSVVAGLTVSAAIAASRLVLGVHWPTDVLAGWALGTGAAVVVTTVVAAAINSRGRRRDVPSSAATC